MFHRELLIDPEPKGAGFGQFVMTDTWAYSFMFELVKLSPMVFSLGDKPFEFLAFQPHKPSNAYWL